MAETLKVLVVDRDRDIIEGLAVRLRDAGYEVIAATDPAKGLNACGPRGPNVILVGVALPDYDGAEALRRCLLYAKPRRIPVISCSNSRSWQLRARAEGVVASLDKPFDIEKLLAVLDVVANRPSVPPATSSRAIRRTPAETDAGRQQASEGPLRASVPDACRLQGVRQRILLVDDDADIRTGTRLRLESAGYEVLCACDGKDALAMAVESHLDLIVMDVRMPGMDGLTALCKLRSLAETSAIPVVMLSASVFDQQSALDGGARFFMKKPYFAPRLLAAVNVAIADGGSINVNRESTDHIDSICGNKSWLGDRLPAPTMVDERCQPPSDSQPTFCSPRIPS